MPPEVILPQILFLSQDPAPNNFAVIETTSASILHRRKCFAMQWISMRKLCINNIAHFKVSTISNVNCTRHFVCCLRYYSIFLLQCSCFSQNFCNGPAYLWKLFIFLSIKLRLEDMSFCNCESNFCFSLLIKKATTGILESSEIACFLTFHDARSQQTVRSGEEQTRRTVWKLHKKIRISVKE